MTDVATISVRVARLDDVDAIRAVDAKVYPEPWSERLTVQQLTGDRRVHLVAIDDEGRVVGHGGVVFLDTDAHITTVAVDPVRQRQGVGDSLVRALFAAADGHGCTAVTLEVRASNTAARALYRGHGMAEAGVRPRYYADNDEDAIIMWTGETEAGDGGRGAERQWSDSVGMETDAEA